MDSGHRTLNLEQAACFLQMSPAVLRQKAKAGVVRGAKPGKRWVFLEADLVAYLRSLYRSPRQALQVTTTHKEDVCHCTNANRRGGYDSPRRVESEYDALLGLRTGPKPKSSTTG